MGSSDWQHHEAIDYFQRAEEHMLHRAPWFRPIKTVHQSGIHLSPHEWENIRQFAAEKGVNWTYNERLATIPRDATYSLEALQQPRALQIRKPFRPDPVPPLKLEVRIGGSTKSCYLQYAGAKRFSDTLTRLTAAQRDSPAAAEAFHPGPAGDIDDIIDLVEAIIDERLVLVRVVRWGEIGHGSSIYSLASDHLVARETPLSLPEHYELETASEAVMYSWTGGYDQRLVDPRHEQMYPYNRP